MNVLENYLLGNAAAPLRKAIIDAKLGEDLTNSGYADYQRDTFFTVGIKGTGEDKAEALLEIVQKTCLEQIEQGVDRRMIEASFHQLELSALDIPSQYPLRLMDRVYRAWLYEGDPVVNLNLRQNLEQLREEYAGNEHYFEELIRRKILENNYRLTLIFYPDIEYNARMDAGFASKMAAVKDGMSPEQLAQIAEEAVKLDAMQASANSPEALATLPKLTLGDVDPQPPVFDFEKVQLGGSTVLDNKIFCGGIDYLHIALDISDFEEELLAFMPVFADVVSKIGAAGMSYAEFAQKEAGCCSGIGATLSVSAQIDSYEQVVPYLNFSVKGVERKLPEMLEVLSQRLLESDFTDKDRLKDIILQSRIGRKTGLVQQGHTIAAAYAGKEISSNLYLSEKLAGITPIRLFDSLAADFEAEAIITRLETIRERILDRDRFDLSVAGSAGARAEVTRWFQDLLEKIGSRGFCRGQVFVPGRELGGYGSKIGLAVPADVAFVARVLPGVTAVSEHAPALSLISQNLSYGYLWNEVRAKRGAYGCKAASQTLAGIYSLASYRDPCIAETLQTYDQILEYIKNDMDLSPAGIEQAIIGTIKNFDVPHRPAAAVMTVMNQLRSGSSYESRLAYRSRLLGLKRADIVGAAEEVFGAKSSAEAPVCVLSSREKLEEAVMNGLPLAIETI